MGWKYGSVAGLSKRLLVNLSKQGLAKMPLETIFRFGGSKAQEMQEEPPWALFHSYGHHDAQQVSYEEGMA